MKYYCEISLDEHCLKAQEVAYLFRIFSISGLPHSRLVSHWLTYFKKISQDKSEDLFFSGRKGMVKVYPKSFYQIAMGQLAKYLRISNGSISFDGKEYRYAIEKSTQEERSNLA